MELPTFDRAGLRITRRLPGGRTNQVFRAVYDANGLVVVKVGAPGSRGLLAECRTLRLLARRGRRVPQVLGGGRCVLDGASRPYLVLELLNGTAPRGVSAHRRLGRGLAELRGLGDQTPWLPRCTSSAVDDRYNDDLAVLAPVLGAELGGLSAVGAPASELDLVHGDPGPDNFVDTGRIGALIDFEAAVVGPPGLDLARACVVTLLTTWSHACAQAVLDGYAEVTDVPSTEELRDWSTLAAVRIAAWRYGNRAVSSTPSWQSVLTLLGRRRWSWC